jgi:hypothetical protein
MKPRGNGDHLGTRAFVSQVVEQISDEIPLGV